MIWWNWFWNSISLVSTKDSRKKDSVQIPSIFFSDGTVVDKAGRHSFEPFMFTLEIFKQALRSKPMAWRNLGSTRGNPKTKFSNADKEWGKQKFINLVGRIHDMFQIITEISMHKWGLCYRNFCWSKNLRMELDGSSQLMEWSKTKYIIIIFQFYFSWVIQWSITNCAVYMVVPKLLMLTAFAIVLANFLMNLAQQWLWKTKEIGGNIREKEFHPIHSFWLMPRRWNSIVQSNLTKWWKWEIIPALKILWYIGNKHFNTS